MQETSLKARLAGKTIALVPTMGFFHKGHISLMHWARKNSDMVVVSLFVNPAQFGPDEDLALYPHDEKRDVKIAESAGADYLFMPRAEDLYPRGFDTWVETPGLSSVLCGESRTGHFRGVTTIVCKLFNLVVPHIAVFGKKDRQQLLIIEKMVRDLNIPVRIKGKSTFREEDGLAMSSRNSYLNPEQRSAAPKVYQGLKKARAEVLAGRNESRVLEDLLVKYYKENIPGVGIDYVRVVSLSTLERASRAGPETFLAVALRLGRARLIDNIDLQPEEETT